MSYKIDDSSNPIGRRYARADELGIPFHVVVDFQSVKDRTVTIRERDTTTPQIRVPVRSLQHLGGIVLFCSLPSFVVSVSRSTRSLPLCRSSPSRPSLGRTSSRSSPTTSCRRCKGRQYHPRDSQHDHVDPFPKERKRRTACLRCFAIFFFFLFSFFLSFFIHILQNHASWTC